MEPVDCKPVYSKECACEYTCFRNAWNDIELSLAAKLLWTLMSERESGFDWDEYLEELLPDDVLFDPLMELVNKGYFDFSFLEIE